jgi:2,3-dihydroxybiphenyl 1,2-dioxygenase
MNVKSVSDHGSSVFGKVQLGYALVDSTKLADWKRFAVEGMGLGIADATPDVLALRIDDRARRLIVRKAPSEDVFALGWQVASADALEEILSRLRTRQVAVEEIGGGQAELRGVERLWRFAGPKRQGFELFLKPVIDPTPPKISGSGFVTGDFGLGHVAITTRKPQEMLAFWREIFDAKISDYIVEKIDGVNLKITFLRINPRHHSVAVAATVGVALDPFATKIQHLEMQVNSLDDVGDAYRRCRSLGFKIAMSVGQHTNDKGISFYAVSPSGFYFELGWNPLLVQNDSDWSPQVHQGISIWGHKPQDQTIGDRLAQMATGVSSLFRNEYTPY